MERTLRKHAYKANYKSLSTCANLLGVLVTWSRSEDLHSRKGAQSAEGVLQAIRALTHHWLILHFMYCSTEACRNLSLDDMDTGPLIVRLRTHAEQDGGLLSSKLVDALVHLYEMR